MHRDALRVVQRRCCAVGAAPRRRAARAALAAGPASRFNAGRYDEVDSCCGGHRPASIVFARAPRSPGPLRRSGEAADACSPQRSPAVTRRSSSGCCRCTSAAAPTRHGRCERLLSIVRPTTPPIICAYCAPRRCRLAAPPRNTSFQEANGFFRDANRLAPDDAAVNTAWGELFLEKYDRPEALKSFQEALKADASYVPALLGLARADARRESAGGAASHRAGAQDQSELRARAPARRRAGARRPQRDEAREAIQKALEVNPNSLEARSLEARMAFLEGRTADFERRRPAGPEDQSGLRRGLSRGRRSRGAQLPLRRGGRADAPRARARSARHPRVCRSRHAPAAHRRRAGARRALERRSRRPFDVVTTTCSAARHARQVRDHHRRRHHHAASPRRAA